MRIKCNDVCVIIGEVPGCEENIGALITVEERYFDAQRDLYEWTFRDANRPLIMKCTETGVFTYHVNMSPRDYLITIQERYLVPYNPPAKRNASQNDLSLPNERIPA